MKTSLSQVSAKLLEFYSLMETLEGELSQEELEKYTILEENFKEAIEDYYLLKDQYASEISYTDSLIKDLQKRKKVLQNRENYLETIIQQSLHKFGTQAQLPSGNIKFEVDLGGLKIVSTPTEVVQIDEEEFEDNSYKTFNIAMNKLSFDDFNIIKPFLDKTLIEMEQTSAIDKIRLKKNLKEKQEIKGASLGLNYNLSKKIKAGSV